MSEISRTALFGKLNELCYQAIESATIFCKMRGNPYVELVHWLHVLLQDSRNGTANPSPSIGDFIGTILPARSRMPPHSLGRES